jgi:hypothetical protein
MSAYYLGINANPYPSTVVPTVLDLADLADLALQHAETHSDPEKIQHRSP